MPAWNAAPLGSVSSIQTVSLLGIVGCGDVSGAQAVTVSVAFFVTGPIVAERGTVVVEETAVEVATAKVCEALPAAIVTDVGIVAACGLPFVRLAVVFTPAVPSRVTVPVAVCPPETDAGETARAASCGVVTVRVAVAVPL